jgi:hypothetical protein
LRRLQRQTRYLLTVSLAFLYHVPFGTKEAYIKEIIAADLSKLASLIKICGFLMQTKVYLFWKKGLEITVMAKLVD